MKFLISEKLGAMCALQSGLFTPNHKKHDLIITITNTETGKKFTYLTSYQYNPSATEYSDGDGVLAVLLDADAYASRKDFLTFCCEFGYSPDEPKARRVFNACRSSYEFFKKAGMTDSEIIQELQERDQ